MRRTRLLIGALLAILLAALGSSCRHDSDGESVRIRIASDNCATWNVDSAAGPVVAPTVRLEVRVSGRRSGTEVVFRDVWISWNRSDGGREVPERSHDSYEFGVEEGTWPILVPLLSAEDLGDEPFSDLLGGSDPATGSSTIRLRATISIYGTRREGWPVAKSVSVDETFRIGGGCSNAEAATPERGVNQGRPTLRGKTLRARP